MVSGEHNDENYAVIEMLVPPSGGPGPHAHKDIQEMFYVVEGEVEFKLEGTKHIAKKGAFINIPLGGAIHCLKNRSDKTANLLCTVVPAGLDIFFKEIGKPTDIGKFLPYTAPSKEDLDKLKTLGEKFGQQFYPPDYLN